jgi:hypothetical protein
VVQVPFETLKRDARDRKAIISGLQQSTTKVAKLAQSLANEKGPGGKAQAALQSLKVDLVKQKDAVRVAVTYALTQPACHCLALDYVPVARPNMTEAQRTSA